MRRRVLSTVLSLVLVAGMMPLSLAFAEEERQAVIEDVTPTTAVGGEGLSVLAEKECTAAQPENEDVQPLTTASMMMPTASPTAPPTTTETTTTEAPLAPMAEPDGSEVTVTFDLGGKPGPYYYDDLSYLGKTFIEMQPPSSPTTFELGSSYNNLPMLYTDNSLNVSVYTIKDNHRYHFLGWSPTGNKEDIVDNSTTVASEGSALTLYAVWEDAGEGAQITLVKPDAFWFNNAPSDFGGRIWVSGTTYHDLFNFSYDNGYTTTEGPVILGNFMAPNPSYQSPNQFQGWYQSLNDETPVSETTPLGSTTLYPKFLDTSTAQTNSFNAQDPNQQEIRISIPDVFEEGTLSLTNTTEGEEVSTEYLTYVIQPPYTYVKIDAAYFKTLAPGTYAFTATLSDCIFENISRVAVTDIRLYKPFGLWNGEGSATAEFGLSHTEFVKRFKHLEIKAFDNATDVKEPLTLEDSDIITARAKDGKTIVELKPEFLRAILSLGTSSYTCSFVFEDGQVIQSVLATTPEMLAGVKIVEFQNVWDGENPFVVKLNISEQDLKSTYPDLAFLIGSWGEPLPGVGSSLTWESLDNSKVTIGTSESDGLATLTLSAEYLRALQVNHQGPYTIMNPTQPIQFSYMLGIQLGEVTLRAPVTIPLESFTGLNVLECFTPWDGTSDLTAVLGISPEEFTGLLETFTFSLNSMEGVISFPVAEGSVSYLGDANSTTITISAEYLQGLLNVNSPTPVSLDIILKDNRPSISLPMNANSIHKPVEASFVLSTTEGTFYDRGTHPATKVDAISQRTFWSGLGYNNFSRNANMLPAPMQYYVLKDDGRCYFLEGWSLESGGQPINTSFYGNVVPETDEITFYAIWSQASTYVPVTLVLPEEGPVFNIPYFNSDDASWRTFLEYAGGSYSSIFSYRMEGFSDEALAVSMPGYTFTGWYLSPDATEPITEDSIVLGTAHNLYARLVPNADNTEGNFGSFDTADAEAALPSIHVEAPLDNFTSLVNTTTNEVVGPEAYTKESGSTILTLSEEYLQSLEPGTYEFRAIFEDFAIEDIQATVYATSVQDAPAAPTVQSKDATSITLSTIEGAQYRLGADGEWQPSPVFTGLTPNTAYTFYAYYPATESALASPASEESAAITTDKAALSGSVTISGTAQFGQVLSADTSGLSATPTVELGALSYQWQRDGAAISGAVGSSYTPVAMDVGTTIIVSVSAANCTGSVLSTPSAPVAKAPEDTSTVYVVIEHPDAWTTDESTGEVSGRIDAPFDKFVQLWLDGSLVSSDNYTVSEGSTIITFKQAYLDSLEVGVHRFRAEFSDGYAVLQLVIAQANAAGDGTGDTGAGTGAVAGAGSAVPATGDTGGIIALVLAAIGAAGLILLLASCCLRKTASQAQRNRSANYTRKH